VSGVAAATNPIGGSYGTAFDGVQAYFDMINSRGGIYGRRLVIAKRHDDNLANNLREVQSIIDQDNAFAVLPVPTILFTGATLLAKNNIPTFGWNIQSDWQGPLNFFPQVGALCIGSDCPGLPLPDLVQRLHKQRVGVLAYSVAQSADCLDLVKASFDKYPVAKVAYATKSLSFGVTDLSADVKKMVDANVDLVTTCMDQNGVLTLAREMRQQGLTAIQYLPNGYDQDFMTKNAGFFEGSVVQAQEAPIETRPVFPALRDYVTWMDKGGYKKTENAEVGWINAAEFVTGLKLAGPNFTRQKVIDALNRLTAYDADGLIGPVNWTRQHTDKHYAQGCQAYMRVHNGAFVPIFGEPGKPFTCYQNTEAPAIADGKRFVRQ
jgi:ABC-type branched-subunit amino acid transport system substrate-binding protein